MVFVSKYNDLHAKMLARTRTGRCADKINRGTGKFEEY